MASKNILLLLLLCYALNLPHSSINPATPEYIAEENPNLILVTTRRGGHFGFLQGLFPIHKTYMNTVLTQFLVAVLEHDCFNLPTSTNDNTTHDNIIHTLL